MSDPEYVEVPVSAAREIAERFRKDIVIINAWDAVNERMNTTTYGVTEQDKRYAAVGGARTAAVLGEDLREAGTSLMSISNSDANEMAIKILKAARQSGGPLGTVGVRAVIEILNEQCERPMTGPHGAPVKKA